MLHGEATMVIGTRIISRMAVLILPMLRGPVVQDIGMPHPLQYPLEMNLVGYIKIKLSKVVMAL